MSMVIMDPTPSVSSSPVAAVNVRPSRHDTDTETGRDPTRVKIFDTTLRDGEQSPGCTMTREEKLVVARQLSKLGVDVIEAGFPIASPGDFEAVKEIAETVGTANNPPIICGLARALKKDIDVCAEAVRPARFPRIHTFIATSDIHMEHKLKKTREQVLAITHEMVSHAKSLIDDVEFSAEDALRSDPEFLAKVFSVAIAAGASTINVPDTVGYTTPGEFKSLIHYLREHVAGIDGVTISVHGHNDLGMAVANFLAAIEGGARQVECTVNGIGERAGNAALEEIVMALHVRKGYFNAAAFARPADSERALTNVVTQELYKSSRLVSSMTGMTVQANKAIVGANAFAHESGIHQDGVLKNKETYEIMDAALVGVVQESNLVLGKHSGRHAFRSRLAEMGYTLADDELNKAFARFKDLADKKKEISVLDLESIVNEEMREATGHIAFALRGVQVLAGNRNTPTATVIIHDKDADTESHIPAIGTGPVDATFQAINAAVAGHARTGDMKLLEYSVDSVTAGIDALGEVTVRVQDATTGRTFFGRGADTDVIYASAMAYVDAINRIVAARAGPTPKHPQKDTSED
ncbi:2-Isopropylmalate synthase [Tribonema minus]|uniref:2-isopropylmalate synthase n=1 Tax=Tribonema minus TaxID=303371 RepID=A0A835YKD7_9STRA|nr:2-Isopropylmalate synthase [Tribonema minus]